MAQESNSSPITVTQSDRESALENLWDIANVGSGVAKIVEDHGLTKTIEVIPLAGGPPLTSSGVGAPSFERLLLEGWESTDLVLGESSKSFIPRRSLPESRLMICN
jgi:hypothetical protein